MGLRKTYVFTLCNVLLVLSYKRYEQLQCIKIAIPDDFKRKHAGKHSEKVDFPRVEIQHGGGYRWVDALTNPSVESRLEKLLSRLLLS